MTLSPSVLCPVDFSDPSRGALRYAAAVAAHFGARLTVATVDDPLLAAAAEGRMGPAWLKQDSRQALEQFVKHAIGEVHPDRFELQFEVTIGKPASEILRLAREHSVDVIVMSTHGLTGARKLFFGSTTERVLRETSVPILVTPGHDRGTTGGVEAVASTVKRIIVPVDLSAATPHQVQIASGLAEAMNVPLILAYVVEPVRVRPMSHTYLPSVESERRGRAERALVALVATIPPQLRAEALVAYGDPAEEIAKIAHDRHAGLIVIGLHSSSPAGPRMGSVTYRVLCLSPTLLLALPPVASRSPSQLTEADAARCAASSRT